jgi:hypothetical protein
MPDQIHKTTTRDADARKRDLRKDLYEYEDMRGLKKNIFTLIVTWIYKKAFSLSVRELERPTLSQLDKSEIQCQIDLLIFSK